MIWKVRVDCERKDVAHPVIRRFLIEADNSWDAMRKGESYAEMHAVFGASWTGFKAREAVSMRLPLEL